MTIAKALGSPTLLGGALLTLSPALCRRVDEPAFRPEPGSSLTKTFLVDSDFSLDDFSAIIGGQDIGQMVGGLEFVIETETEITVSDLYAEIGDGRPERLERTFDSLESSATVTVTTQFGDENQEIGSSSSLEGSTVVFEWNDEDEEYELSFSDDAGDEDLLDGLIEEMDLRVLLPGEEVSVDDSWEVDLGDLGVIAAPGGNLHFVPEDMGDVDFEDTEIFEQIFGEQFSEEFKDLIEGTCECVYVGSTDVEGRELGEIRVTLEIATAIDLTEFLVELMTAIADEVGEEIPVDVEIADFNLDFEGEGTLLWDLAGGHAASFELDGDMEIAVDLGISVDDGSGPQMAEIALELSGSYGFALETE